MADDDQWTEIAYNERHLQKKVSVAPPPGLNEVREADWRAGTITIDSGAAESVAPVDAFPETSVVENEN